MSRIKADLLLLLVAVIWGGAFVAQKDSLATIGPCTFVAVRFFISLILVLPLAAKEYKRKRKKEKLFSNKGELFLLCSTFSAGIILQQIGLVKTTVTNAGFLTGLYVLFVPVICKFFYKQRLSRWVFPAALMSITGIWLLSGSSLDGFSSGDILVIACALVFAIQVSLISKVARDMKAPLVISVLQYAFVTLVALIGAALFEHPTLEGLRGATWPILYAGVISGGIAYTLQVVAQQYTTAADSAIILSGESVFAALGGALMLREYLTTPQYFGCALITIAITLTEVMPLFLKKKAAR